MAGYSIISDVSEKLIQLLQEEMVPGVLDSKDQIGLCTPADKSDMSLGLYLFDIRESEEIRRSNMVSLGVDAVRYPPIYLNLYYMVTAYASGDVRYRMAAEERILGKVIQYFHDYAIIPIDDLDTSDMSGVDLHIEMLRMDAEQKSKIWAFPNIPYKTSLFYKVAPVSIDSERMNKVTRVRQVEINVSSEKERRT